MAKAIVTYCDVCLQDDDTYTEGTSTPPLQLGRAKPRTLDLCDEHRKQYVTPFEELLQRLGSAIDRAPAPIAAGTVGTSPAASTREAGADDEQCLVCGDSVKRSSAESHYAAKHPDASRARLLRDAGIIDTIFECDVKEGRQQCPKAFITNQGLAMHKMRSHGIAHAAQ